MMSHLANPILTGSELRNLHKGRIARARRHVPGTMNAGEKRYAEHLEHLRRAGEVESYAFERVKIRLADKSFFTPDFFVVLPSMEIEFHEVKPKSRKGYWCEEDAKLKIKFAAETFPARFFIVWPGDGGWNREEF